MPFLLGCCTFLGGGCTAFSLLHKFISSSFIHLQFLWSVNSKWFRFFASVCLWMSVLILCCSSMSHFTTTNNIHVLEISQSALANAGWPSLCCVAPSHRLQWEPLSPTTCLAAKSVWGRELFWRLKPPIPAWFFEFLAFLPPSRYVQSAWVVLITHQFCRCVICGWWIMKCVCYFVLHQISITVFFSTPSSPRLLASLLASFWGFQCFVGR